MNTVILDNSKLEKTNSDIYFSKKKLEAAGRASISESLSLRYSGFVAIIGAISCMLHFVVVLETTQWLTPVPRFCDGAISDLTSRTSQRPALGFNKIFQY